MKSALFLPILFLFPLVSSAQFEINGTILNKDSDAIAYANIALYQQQDSTFVEGTISDEKGDFSFSKINKGNYFLEASFMGYQKQREKLNVTKNLNLPAIILKMNSEYLDEVTLKSRKPEIRRASDRIIFDIENTSISSGNTWDAIRMAPGVITINDDLKIRNTTATIYINERKVDLTSDELKQLLESFSAEDVKQIEILRNPSAKYDAGDGPIINIVTTKMLVPGYKGSVNASYTQAIYAKYNLGMSHYYKNDKLNVLMNYSYSPSKKIKQDESYVNYINNENEVFNRWRTDFDRITRENSHQANVILDYKIDEKNTINFSANGVYSPDMSYNNKGRTRAYSPNFVLDSTFTTEARLSNDLTNLGYDLDFNHQFKSNTSLSVNLHSTYYDSQTIQMLYTDYFTPDDQLLDENNLATNSAQKINIYAGQADFETVFGTYKFSTGLKYSDINSESFLNFYELESDAAPFADQYLSDRFQYNEMVYAAYVSANKDWDKFSAQLGLRVEHTDREGRSMSLNEFNNRDYTEFFPSLYLNYKASENHSFGFDYGRKIDRPKYESLNPFRYFITENNFQSGNPALRAAISNQFNLNYTFKNKYSFDFYYRDNGQNVAQLVFQDNENLFLRSVQANVLESKSYGVDFFHGRSLKDWWYAQAVLSGFHEEETFLALESNLAEVTNDVNGFYAMFFNSIMISKEKAFSGNLTLFYLSDFIQGSYQVADSFNVSIGLKKKVWDRKGELSLFFSDVFNEFAPQLNSTYLNQDNGYYALPENRFVRVGFKYNFGNNGLKDNNRSIDAEERDRL